MKTVEVAEGLKISKCRTRRSYDSVYGILTYSMYCAYLSSYRLYVDRMSEGLQPFVVLSLDDEQLQYCTRNANKLVNVWIVLAD
jgi:hypothetical protein